MPNDPKYDWIPLVCFIFIIFTGGMGLQPIPYILIYEIFPRKVSVFSTQHFHLLFDQKIYHFTLSPQTFSQIQEISLAITVSSIWIFMGLLGYLFPLILSTFGVMPILIALSITSILNAFFGVRVLPETRGKSHEEIMEVLQK